MYHYSSTRRYAEPKPRQPAKTLRPSAASKNCDNSVTKRSALTDLENYLIKYNNNESIAIESMFRRGEHNARVRSERAATAMEDVNADIHKFIVHLRGKQVQRSHELR